MELQDAIGKRRTVRDFIDRAVSPEIIDRALSAGLKAPSYNHLKEWHFILVKDQDVRAALTQTESMVERVSDELRQSFAGYEPLVKDMYLDAIPKQKRMIMAAPELLVVVYKPKTQIAESKRVYDLNCLASVWCCIENILLSFAECDVFGVTFIPQNTPAVKGVLNIPQELEAAAIIPFGYRDQSVKPHPPKEVALDERLHADRW